MENKAFFFFLVLWLTACEKAELPKPASSANTESNSVNMGSDYATQLFFSLDEDKIISQDLRESWDLGFDASGNIFLNSSKSMSVSITGATDLSSVGASTSTTWIYDQPEGYTDSLAFSNWQSGKVYIVDRGITTTGGQIGKIKLIINQFAGNTWSIDWAVLSSQDSHHVEFAADNTKDFTALSFASAPGAIVDIDPGKDKWDLLFSTYTHMYDDGMPYLVNGILLNSNGVTACQVEATTFGNVTYDDIASLDFSAMRDVIGFDWKTYNFDTGLYQIDLGRVYVVKSVSNRYYKLRMLDFYDQSGQKGNPSFEIKELVP